MSQIQSWLVVRSPSFTTTFGRVNGLTYEASWFAHQMVMIYLPLWIAASYSKTSAFKFRVFHISVENILLVFGLGAFFLSSPRIGLVSFLLDDNLPLHKIEFVNPPQNCGTHLELEICPQTWILQAPQVLD